MLKPSPAGSQASSPQNDQIDLLCFTEVRARPRRDMGQVNRKRLPLSVTSSIEISVVSKSGQRKLTLDGSKPPAPPIPQVKLPHSGRNITLGTADRLMQLCSSQLVLAIPFGAICLLTMGSCAINLAVCASLREPPVCTELRHPGTLVS